MKRLLFVACFILFGVAGCTAVSREPALEPASEPAVAATIAPTIESTAVTLSAEPTPIPTDTPMPPPTAVPTEAVPPAPPLREQVDNLTAVTADTIAYVQNDQLYIRALPDNEPVAVEAGSCVGIHYCIISHLKWSPDGQYLLYYFYDGSNDITHLHLSDREGNVQIIKEATHFYPGAWSPDGRNIAFMKSVDERMAVEDERGAWRYEVWTVPFSEEGILGTPELAGAWPRIGDGCGGGGRSVSENLYEDEGGTSYGYLMGIMEWTPQDILLYTINCDNIGIGRYDLTTNTNLPGFDRPLRNLVLNASGDRWYAVTGHAWDRDNPESNQLVTGTPDSTEVTVIPTSVKVELIFIGQQSGAIYYTERNPLGRESFDSKGLYFGFFESALWRIQPDGTGEERLLFGADAHAYVQVTETAVGDLLFVLVENERPLAAAAQFVEGNPEKLQAYYPQRHILQLPANEGEPIMILSNAGQPALALP